MGLKDVVKEKYGQAALRVKTGASACCGASAERDGCCDPITSNLYDDAQTGELPREAVLASLGCGNPAALAQLNPGETVLDLGSGGGIDVLLSARRVGPSGKAYGLDMTDEMLALARENQRKAGIENVEFLKDEIESIPLPDNSVDVIISNCVINLSGDKDRVLREAFRVLKPGGRFAVSDVVARGEVPADLRQNMLLWVGCIAGALQDDQYISKLTQAGFEDIGIEPTRIYDIEDARTFLSGQGVDVDAIASQVQGKFMSAFIRASKRASGCAFTGFERVEAIARTLPDVEATTAWGQPALKVRGRMFACLASHKSAEPNTLVVRMDFARRDALIDEEPGTYYLKEHYTGYPCVLVRLSRVRPDALRELIIGAHRYVSDNTPKKLVRPGRRTKVNVPRVVAK